MFEEWRSRSSARNGGVLRVLKLCTRVEFEEDIVGVHFDVMFLSVFLPFA